MHAATITLGSGGVGAILSDMLCILLIIAAGLVFGGILIPRVWLLVHRGRASRHARRAREERVTASADAERRARALMSELCPHGWRGHITLYDGRSRTESGETVRADVALDWCELRPGGAEPAVMRRVWAPTIADALEAMVADRRTDQTLEQIELRASASGALWPDW